MDWKSIGTIVALNNECVKFEFNDTFLHTKNDSECKSSKLLKIFYYLYI